MKSEADCRGVDARPPRRRAVLAALGALLAMQLALLLVLALRDFVVVDELGHVPAGLSHWQTGTFHLYCVNPPLVRMVAALPLLLAGPEVDLVNLHPPARKRGEWQFGRDFARANGARYMGLITSARLPIIAWTLAGTMVIFRWARDLYGDAGGLVAAAAWSLDPTVLTFGHLVVPDVPSAVAALAATYAFWRYLRRPSWRMAAAAGLLLGVAELTKFTLLVLYGVWPVLWLACRPWRREGEGGLGHLRPGALAAQSALILGLSLLAINLGYGFRGSFARLDAFDFVSESLSGTPREVADRADAGPGVARNRFRGTPLGALPVPVPADFLRGIDFQRLDFEAGMPSYLNGRWRDRGWYEYYLCALAVKEPVGTWVLVLWSLALVLVRHPACAPRADEITLLLPAFAVLGFVSSQTGFNHHMRYVLPVFPFLAVAVGKLAWHLIRGPIGPRLAAAAALAGLGASSLASFPCPLSYFNELAGGPANGHRYLADSNIDWGQDLLALKRWLAAHPEARPLGLAFNHMIDPRVEGIDFAIPPEGRPEGLPVDEESAPGFGPWPGYYAVSVSILIGTKCWMPDGRWGLTPINRPDHFAYFSRFRPIEIIGNSIYIFHITPDDADRVRRELGLPPLPPDAVPSRWGRRAASISVAGERVE